MLYKCQNNPGNVFHAHDFNGLRKSTGNERVKHFVNEMEMREKIN